MVPVVFKGSIREVPEVCLDEGEFEARITGEQSCGGKGVQSFRPSGKAVPSLQRAEGKGRRKQSSWSMRLRSWLTVSTTYLKLVSVVSIVCSNKTICT